jgi:hypothetical protein
VIVYRSLVLVVMWSNSPSATTDAIWRTGRITTSSRTRTRMRSAYPRRTSIGQRGIRHRGGAPLRRLARADSLERFVEAMSLHRLHEVVDRVELECLNREIVKRRDECHKD